MKPPRIPFIHFYPCDFIVGVRGLTPLEVGIYMMLLCRIYEEDGPVEHHIPRLAAYCNCSDKVAEKAVDRLVLLGKLTLRNGLLSNPRGKDGWGRPAGVTVIVEEYPGHETWRPIGEVAKRLVEKTC